MQKCKAHLLTEWGPVPQGLNMATPHSFAEMNITPSSLVHRFIQNTKYSFF